MTAEVLHVLNNVCSKQKHSFRMTGLLMNNKPHMHRSVWLTNQHREPPKQEAHKVLRC